MIRPIGTMSSAGALVAMLGLWTSAPAIAGTHQDPKALAVVDAVEKAIAPDNGWSKVGGLRFTFSVVKDGKTLAEVHHVWDVRSGQYRVDWSSKEGDQRLAIFNVGAKGRQGEAYMRGERTVTGAPATPATPATRPPRPPGMAGWLKAPDLVARQMLETGYGRFINDTYWLLMPLKMKDPGVNLDYDGEKTIDTKTYDVLKVTFDQVGLTPGDTYWVYVNRDTHLIDRWEYVLEGDAAKPKEPKEEAKGSSGSASAKDESPKAPQRTLWIWKEWQSFGPVKLATVKTMGDGSTSIVLKNVDVLPSMEEKEFRPPVGAKDLHPTPHVDAKPKKG